MASLTRRLLPSNSIRFSRPLRPPSASPSPRPFTQNSQLLLLAHHTPRPQLPYLAQPSFRRTTSPDLTRLISTETRAYVKEVSWLSVKYSALIFAFMTLGSVAYMGFQMEVAEREHPTPDDWKMMTRHALRRARTLTTVVQEQKAPIVDWPMIGGLANEVLRRLENLEGEGKGLVVQGGEGAGVGEALLIPEVGKAGFDIEAKGREWRTGYHEALMLAAVAAEHLDNMVLDTTRKLVFPKQCVIGPSNPDPRPTPVYMHSAPLEENCKPMHDPPETYYMRVLTTKGFTTKQKLDAVEGYANWLEYKGLPESAEEMYKWGIDIAKSSLPNTAAANTVLDSTTNTLKSDARPEDMTSNLLRATTNLAIHYARNAQTASALPIFLSVLRARRSAPVVPSFAYNEETEAPATTDIGSAINMVKRVFRTSTFPPPPPSGDTPLARQSSSPTCEEGELMVYVGEILFASAPERASEGVGWTRQGVLIAEANLASQEKDRRLKKSSSSLEEAQKEDKRCKECLLTGVKNWEIMLERLSESRLASAGREGGRDAGWLEWRGWFGVGGGKGRTMEELSVGMLDEELKVVGRLRERIVREDIEAQMERAGAVNGGLWFG